MKIEVVKEFTFDSAHFLPGHKGKCKETHGHTYHLQIGVKGKVDSQTGMVIDFGDLKEIVKERIIDKLDHKLLNHLDEDIGTECDFPSNQPTAENMVLWIAEELRMAFLLNLELPSITFVRLYETPTSYAEWRKE